MSKNFHHSDQRPYARQQPRWRYIFEVSCYSLQTLAFKLGHFNQIQLVEDKWFRVICSHWREGTTNMRAKQQIISQLLPSKVQILTPTPQHQHQFADLSDSIWGELPSFNAASLLCEAHNCSSDWWAATSQQRYWLIFLVLKTAEEMLKYPMWRDILSSLRKVLDDRVLCTFNQNLAFV